MNRPPHRPNANAPVWGFAALAGLVVLILWNIRDHPHFMALGMMLLAVLIAGGAGLLFWRQSQMAQAMTELEALPDQVEAALKEGRESAAKSAQKSLDRIHNQLGQLSQLQKDMADLRRQLNNLSAPAPAPAAPPAKQEAAPQAAQPSFDLSGLVPAQTHDLSAEEFIAAMNFPLDENDTLGFEIFRRAMVHPATTTVLRAAQDVLTFLAEDGIYTDDLRPDYARAELWRKFAQGERGRNVADIGGVREREVLAKVMKRMRSDNVFRDSGHHFLRHFDKALARFAQNASDQDLMALSDTRTARAFMLLGRVAGTFD